MKKITIIGFIGADATTAVHQDKTVYNFSIGVQDDYRENGEWKKRTDWMQISYWQNKEVNYLKKGNMLYIEGTPHIHSYQNNQGVTQSCFKITASVIKVLVNKQVTNTAAPSSSASNEMPSQEIADDLPF